MKEVLSSLNNRDIALFIWISLFVVLILFKKDIRRTLAEIIKLLFLKKLAPIFFLMIIYIVVIVFALYKLSFWDIALLKRTIYWFFGTAFVMFINTNRATSEKEYFKNIILDNLKISVFIEFVVNVYVFNLIIEFFLLPVVVSLSALITMSGTKSKFMHEKNFLNKVVSVLGILILIYVGIQIKNNFSSFATVEHLKDLLLPPLLTFVFLPFIYFFALLNIYESMFVRLKIFQQKKDQNFIFWVKWKIFCACLFNLATVNEFSKNYANELMFNSNRKDVNILIAKFKHRE